ncbi:MAG: ATP-dependent DNA helicase [Pelosinus sp.]|nr:ATP-dependent DNA helicase [Pelosinus sp.]
MSIGEVVKISVRDLVEFILRSGDLTGGGFVSSSRALEGGRIHRKIQKEQGAEYQAEVTLTYQFKRNSLVLEVGGRADGIITEASGAVTIDEIKSTTKPLALLEASHYPLYWAQAKCYAFIYAEEKELTDIKVQLTYCQLDTLEIKKFWKVFTQKELQEFFSELVNRYFDWAERLQSWREVRNASADGLPFPFKTYREGQRQLAVTVYKAIGGRRRLYAQAPTGTGKTIATIFPAVKAVGQGLVEKIFFLTAKTVTRSLAEEAFDRLRQCGLKFKTVTLTAKEKVCFTPGAACSAEECSYAKGYFDRVNIALTDSFMDEIFTRSTIEDYARKHSICPFEFSLDLALWADAVICDYNYVFDPRVYLKRFFAEGGEYCFLIDEAHNLVDRAREMFSAELNKRPFLALKRAVKATLPKLSKAAGSINTKLLSIGKLCGETAENNYFINKEAPQDIIPLLYRFLGLAEEWLAQNDEAEFREALLDEYFAVYGFLRVFESYDDKYITYAERILEDGKEDVRVKLFCVDPSFLLSQALERGRSAVLFSATLTPLEYFRKILGGRVQDGILSVASPFSRHNLCLLVADTISTTYKMRVLTYGQVVESIATVISKKNGNYLVFFPSYQYLNQIYQSFCLMYPEIKTICQSGDMKEEDRTLFLNQFTALNKETLVGFAVLGGAFGEGVDLPGECLIGAIIVGVGLPQVCREREIIRDFFQSKGCGFEYAYMYPGMNKVLQAAGRVIRTEADQGIVLLIDERFSHTRYRRLFPPEWRGSIYVSDSQSLAKRIKTFWENMGNKA